MAEVLIYGFVALPLVCILLERRWPQVKGYRIFRRGFGSDVLWYVVQSFVSRIVAPWIVFIAVIPVLLAVGHPLEDFLSGFGPLAALPLWTQALLVLVGSDFLGYWQHRLFHTRALWPVHAVHHSSEELDWLSATRFHPLNEIGAQLIYAAPLLAVGFSPMAFVLLAPFVAAYQVLLHANVDLSFGPLRHLLASPVFHRWHHTLAPEAQDKNFAGIFPLWDVIFGTFHHPLDRKPEVFGAQGEVPAGFGPQLLHPFRASTAAPPPRAANTAAPQG